MADAGRGRGGFGRGRGGDRRGRRGPRRGGRKDEDKEWCAHPPKIYFLHFVLLWLSPDLAAYARSQCYAPLQT